MSKIIRIHGDFTGGAVAMLPIYKGVMMVIAFHVGFALEREYGGRFRLVGTVSVAFGCPFEGKVDPASVLDDVARFGALGVDHVAIGDTTGMATPVSVKNLFSKVKSVTPAVGFGVVTM